MADPTELRRAAAIDEARADAAERDLLDPDVRELGSAFRAYGLADAAGDEQAIALSRGALAIAGMRAIALGEEGALRLRAYQLRAFLREVKRWEITGDESSELRALGGGFIAMLRRNGWCLQGEGHGARRRVLLDDAAQRAAFKLRWSEVTGLTSATFRPTLDEQRAFFRLLLVRPLPFAAPVTAGFTQGYQDQYRLKKIEELSAIDPTYPAELARGIVLHRLGRYSPAAQAFRRHLDASPDGPFTLRAQNYLRAALENARAQEGDEGDESL
jgi:hypothetical protein